MMLDPSSIRVSVRIWWMCMLLVVIVCYYQRCGCGLIALNFASSLYVSATCFLSCMCTFLQVDLDNMESVVLLRRTYSAVSPESLDFSSILKLLILPIDLEVGASTEFFQPHSFSPIQISLGSLSFLAI